MIVAIANQKGGVGKTTTAINLASAFALHGKPTLLIDLDPQANSTMSILDPQPDQQSIYDVIVDASRQLADIIVSSKQENLSVAPARIALAKLESHLVGEFDAHFRLKDRIDTVTDRYPFIVIDCPADARPADRQRTCGSDGPVDPDSVLVLCSRGHRRSPGNSGAGAEAGQPDVEHSGGPDHDA